MALPNLYSRRQRNKNAPAGGDVYQYDDLPNKLRVQIIMIWKEALGDFNKYDNPRGANVFNRLVELIRKETGRFDLADVYTQNAQEEISNWFLKETDLDICLDAVEFSFFMIDGYVRDNTEYFRRFVSSSPDSAIAELNARMIEAGVGFQYINKDIVRIDSLLVHTEVVIPALTLLSDPTFEGPESEFREAHRLYRRKDYELALTECCKCFESVLKVIGKQRGWAISNTDPAGKLLSAAFSSDLIPQYLQSEFSGLKTLLESGIPTVRNKTSGHGTGSIARVVPEHLAAFQLHQTAAAILFLIAGHKANPVT